MEDIYISAAKLSLMMGIGARTIERYKAQGKIEGNKSGYGVISTYKYYVELLKEDLDKKQQQLDQQNDVAEPIRIVNLKVQKLEAEVRERNAIADIKELERDKLQGSLIEVDEVVNHYKDLVIRAKAKFLSLPDKLALELSGMSEQGEIQELLQLRIDECLTELSSENVEVADQPVDDDI